MATYNTFVVQETKGGKAVLVTSSARKAQRLIKPGIRVEVWNNNRKAETVHTRNRDKMTKYTNAERDYIRAKQAAAERRNRARRTKSCR